MKRIVLYHAHCLDGYTAAWAAWRRFGESDTTYLPVQYGEDPPDVTGAEVFVLDFSYKRDVMLVMHAQAQLLAVLDHHKTAEAELSGLSFVQFDMDRSGAKMAWNYFHPNQAAPWLVNYVEDRDLWRFKLPNSKAVNAGIGASPRENFHQWSTLEAQGCDAAVGKGEGILLFQNSYISSMVKHARSVEFCGYTIPVVNMSPILVSEVVGKLAEAAPFALGWFQRSTGEYQYSLRSRGQGGVDVSEIAKRFGGGGHKNAAGFVSKDMLRFDGSEG